VLVRALAKRPADRYATMREFKQALEAALAPKPAARKPDVEPEAPGGFPEPPAKDSARQAELRARDQPAMSPPAPTVAPPAMSQTLFKEQQRIERIERAQTKK